MKLKKGDKIKVDGFGNEILIVAKTYGNKISFYNKKFPNAIGWIEKRFVKPVEKR